MRYVYRIENNDNTGMKRTEIEKLLGQIESLTAEEISKVKKVLARREGRVEGSVVLQEKEESVEACPHCGSKDIAKAGSKGGRRRYKCKAEGCGKSFNALTGTPLARLRMSEKHIENARCMAARLSIPKTAERLGVSWETAFRWRHRFLRLLADRQPEQLAGIVEADETFFRESFKGQRSGLPRPSKKRGTPAASRGLSKEQVPVLVARDRASGATLSKVVKSTKAKDLEPVLMPRLTKDAMLMTDGASAYKTLGKAHGVAVKGVPANKGHKTSGLAHINNVNAYDERLKGWMFPFKGVATKYLQSYLGWHRWLDADKKSGKARRLLRAALG